MKKLTIEIIKERLKEINSNIEILSEEYINNNTKLKCRCNIDEYIWEVTWGSLSQGNGCPECSGKRRDYTINIIKEKLYKINPNIEILSDRYLNCKTHLDCRCKIDGHVWKSTWNHLGQGKGCPLCGYKNTQDKQRFTLDFVVKKMKKINPNIQILSNEYMDSKTHLKCKCKIDGYEWSITWKHLSQGRGCPECAGKRTDYTINDIREKLHIINPNIEILSSEYVNSNKNKLKCKCLIDGHEWQATWGHLSQGRGCPRCKASKGERIIFKMLLNKNIPFKDQYKFKDCKIIKPLPFDFALLDNSHKLVSLIEYDGEQHFRPVNFGGMSDEKAIKFYGITKQNDEIKNTYCKENNIPLLRIPYWEKDNIESILDEWLEKIGLIKGVSGNETLMS